MEPIQSTETIQRLRQQWLKPLYSSLAVLIAIHLLPKSREGAIFRLLLTMAYFGAALTLLYQLTTPRHQYWRKYYKWRYEDCGPALEQDWKLYLSSLSRSINIVVYLLMLMVIGAASSILSEWFTSLAAFSFYYTAAYWVSLAGLMLFPIAGANLISETYQRYILLAEHVETSGFVPRSTNDLNASSPDSERPAVEILGDYKFRAGGMEWEWEDFYKNAVVFGQPGTGKTVCVLNAILDGLLASTQALTLPPSGLILDPKGDFYSKIQKVCLLYGREQDLLILDPSSPDQSMIWNPLDSEDDELELAARFAAVMESTGQKAGSDSFWIESAKKFIRHSIALIRLSNPHGHPPTFSQILQLATNFESISNRASLLLDEDPGGDQCLEFFDHEWTKLADNTRSSIQAYITNMIDPFLMAPYSQVFAGRSGMRISDILSSGKLLYVHMPIADKETMSRVICTFVKLEYYREVLKRPNKKRASFLLCDEFQSFFTTTQGKGDADFFERSRQSNHANIVATQNMPALLKQAEKEDRVKNLLGNCAVKIFLRNTDDQTNQYASSLFGQRIVAMAGSSLGARGGKFQIRPQSGHSVSHQYDAEVRPEDFTKLAIPDRVTNTDFCESIIHLASRAQVSKAKLKWKTHPLTD
jgi:hypothetical protein